MKVTKLLRRLLFLLACSSFPVTIFLVNLIENTSVIQPHWAQPPPLPTNSTNKKQKQTHPLLEDKDNLIELLRSQNVNLSMINKKTWAKIPTWSRITELYGDAPVVVGLERCKEFRQNVPEEKRIVAPGGLFNTGTNLLAQLLQGNCHMPARVKKYGKRRGTGMEWQVPWGKHSPPEFRNMTIDDPQNANMNKDDVLPIIAIREPYDWMKSTCHNNYVLRWPHRGRCPNLIQPNGTLVQVMNQYFHGSIKRYHKSLAHFWNDWNRQYTGNTSFPRLMVRHKDLVFFPKETIGLVCACAGGEVLPAEKFQFVMDAAKPNRKGFQPFDGLIGNWIKYGKEFSKEQFPLEDVQVAEEVLDKDIMTMFDFK